MGHKWHFDVRGYLPGTEIDKKCIPLSSTFDKKGSDEYFPTRFSNFDQAGQYSDFQILIMLASILISPCWPGWENTSAEVSGRPWKSHLAPHFMIVHFVLPPPLMIVHVEFCRIWWSSTLSFASFDNRPPCFAASFDHHPCYFGCWVRWVPSS